MSEPPPTPWIHIGECPVCVNGLCRLRTCAALDGTLHFYALCDECEALWLEPHTDAPRMFPDATEPICPICSQPLYGEQAHWSLAAELPGTKWATNAIFEVPSTDGLNINSSVDFQDDLSYGQDEPKPGC